MFGKGYTWFPVYTSMVDCGLARLHLRAGLPGYEKDFVIPEYWEDDAILKTLESRLLNESQKAMTLEEEEGTQEEEMKE